MGALGAQETPEQIIQPAIEDGGTTIAPGVSPGKSYHHEFSSPRMRAAETLPAFQGSVIYQELIPGLTPRGYFISPAIAGSYT
ncbi:MAG TPA: hypothetical protein VGW36_09855 [Pyrinomonadaceae bacterium]|nr:hypothetical protein [Pyrinomonadaceae bacterium]